MIKTVALLLLLLVPLAAQDKGTQNKSVADFPAWWKQFQAAVVKREAAIVSKGSKFPMQWENGPTRNVQVATAFAARFDFYFTSDLKNIIASRTPMAEGREGYTITWKARGNEYTLYFKDRGQGWALDGLSEGPP
ncbi:MAG: hypothetical protein ABIR70_23675 [Bryobacteraceae bacterium]